MKAVTLSLILSATILSQGAAVVAAPPTSSEVMSITRKAADWQIETFEDQPKYRAPRTNSKGEPEKNYHDLLWQMGALYTGLYELAETCEDAKYFDFLRSIGDKHDWNLFTRMYHADDHAVGLMYLEMYDRFGEKKMLKPTRKRFDAIMKSDRADEWHWTWCDALFMAPPVWAKLAQVTGKEKYLEYMHEQYMMTYDKLWSSEEQLFFRDERYITQYEANGENIFWSRGNGWVYGGLALMIPTFPQGWEHTPLYIEMFKQISQTLKETQREDGSWSGGLLGTIEAYPEMETSGTAFFAYGLAWGINNDILDRATYEPVLLAAWDALVSATHENGMLGYVQGVGAAPGKSSYEYTETYGIGAYAAAGSEMYRYVKRFFE